MLVSKWKLFFASFFLFTLFSLLATFQAVAQENPAYSYEPSLREKLEASPFSLAVYTDTYGNRHWEEEIDKDGYGYYRLNGYGGSVGTTLGYKVPGNWLYTSVTPEVKYTQDTKAHLDNIALSISGMELLRGLKNFGSLSLSLTYQYKLENKYYKARVNKHSFSLYTKFRKNLDKKFSFQGVVGLERYFEDKEELEIPGSKYSRLRLKLTPSYSFSDKATLGLNFDFSHYNIRKGLKYYPNGASAGMAANATTFIINPEINYDFTDRLSGSIYYEMTLTESGDGRDFVESWFIKGSPGFGLYYSIF